MAKRLSVVVALLQLLLIGLWLLPPMSVHNPEQRHWYQVVPVFFVIGPAATVVSAVIGRSNDQSVAFYTLLLALLTLNLVAFGVYALLSGGGV